MNRPMSPLVYQNMVNAINGAAYDRRLFEAGYRHQRFGSGLRPDGVDCPTFPGHKLAEWRANPAWSLAHLARHQAGCEAAWRAYWAVFSRAPNDQPATTLATSTNPTAS